MVNYDTKTESALRQMLETMIAYVLGFKGLKSTSKLVFCTHSVHQPI